MSRLKIDYKSPEWFLINVFYYSTCFRIFKEKHNKFVITLLAETCLRVKGMVANREKSKKHIYCEKHINKNLTLISNF